VLDDTIGLELAAPGDGWRDRPDMDLTETRGARATVVARARFLDDLVAAQTNRGIGQYAILGAGLDTLVQRQPQLASHLTIHEVDQPAPQTWKRARLTELGYGIPNSLHLIPVDFEAGDDWWQHLTTAGFHPGQPAVIASAGVSMYLTQDATVATLRRIAACCPGTALAMTFQLPTTLLDPADRPARRATERGARDAGTPFISYYQPHEILALARQAGFTSIEHVSAADLAEQYFTGRPDGLRPSSAEHLIVATT
jgi:methyltransferase (TIGR00027 family)